MKLSILITVAATASAQVPSTMPIYTSDYSGIDNSSIGKVIRSIAGSDNKRKIRENVIKLLGERNSNRAPDQEASLRALGFDCNHKKCEYTAFYESKITADSWSQSSRTTYLISIPDSGNDNSNSNKIEINITKSTMDPRNLGKGEISHFLHRWPPFQNEEEIRQPVTDLINEKLSNVKIKNEKLKTLGFTCSDKCSYIGYLNIHTIRDYKVTDESYKYEITTSLSGEDLSAKVKLTKNEE